MARRKKKTNPADWVNELVLVQPGLGTRLRIMMKMFFTVLIGFLLLGGAAAGWRYWEITEVIAIIIGFLGMSLIYYGCTGKNLL